ncbi:MAG: hypothetical protein RR961_10980 [Eubacterium sp.]
MNKDEMALKRRLEAGNFAGNNGRIIRTVNVLKGKWIALGTVKDALSDVDNIEQSLIYLERGHYLIVRNIETREAVEMEDAKDDTCEVTLTKHGIDLALYYIEDPAVKV